MGTEDVRLLVELLALCGACLLGVLGWVYSRDRNDIYTRLTYIEQNMVTREDMKDAITTGKDGLIRQFLTTP